MRGQQQTRLQPFFRDNQGGPAPEQPAIHQLCCSVRMKFV